MELPDETDLQQLADLMTHRGWVLFRAHCEREWGDGGFGRRVASVMKARGPEVAGPILAQMTVAQSEIQAYPLGMVGLGSQRLATRNGLIVQRPVHRLVTPKIGVRFPLGPLIISDEVPSFNG